MAMLEMLVRMWMVSGLFEWWKRFPIPVADYMHVAHASHVQEYGVGITACEST